MERSRINPILVTIRLNQQLSAQITPKKAVDLEHMMILRGLLYKLHTNCSKIKPNLKLTVQQTTFLTCGRALLDDLGGKGLMIGVRIPVVLQLQYYCTSSCDHQI